jgi:proteasome lid subunit RPN8/RPN11
MRILDPDVLAAARAHALAEYPMEACGGVTAAGYIPFCNASPDPLNYFECSHEMDPLFEAGELFGLVHSHPMVGATEDPIGGPSELDMRGQIAMAIPWGIVVCSETWAGDPYYWGDMLEPPPLIGRPFRHGPSATDGRGDCGALVKDWYRINRGVVLEEFPREWDWWNQPGKDLYSEHFGKYGFEHAPRNAPEVGDLVLMRIMSRVTNHAGIYIGDGMMLHHLAKRVSRIEPIIHWMNSATHWLRRAG